MRKEYKDLVVWQKGMDLVVAVYEITVQLLPEERFGLASQMNRCVISIPSNIAEGKLRGSQKDCRRFFLMAYGSGGELETQLGVIKRLPQYQSIETEKVEKLLEEVMKILNVLVNKKIVSGPLAS